MQFDPTTVRTPLAVRARGIQKRYGGVTALDGVDLTVEAGEVFGIIGPNGAGKSTLFDILCGITRPSAGEVELFGHSIAQVRPHEVARMGVARSFQRTAVFGDATVRQNLQFGRYGLSTHSVLGRIFHSKAWRKDRESFEIVAEEVLERTGLAQDQDRPASVLAYGVQRRLAVAVALMAAPKLLFLDEPAAGMNGRESADFVALIRAIAPNRTIVIVEHDMQVIKALCGRALVMVNGRPVTSGAPDQVFRHPEVIEAYLGAEDE
ncbi:MAG: ABC transporter ATP-binding protein [Comamonadaceae bacterium]|nr:MAG: ABC transporter ATP-binding protein [Comamonadaceae bacterium]